MPNKTNPAYAEYRAADLRRWLKKRETNNLDYKQDIAYLITL